MKNSVETKQAWFGKGIAAIIIVLTCLIMVTYSDSSSLNVVTSQPETITFLLGESTIVKTPWPTVRVAVTDPTIANVNVLTPQQVMLQGLKVGSTDLIVWSENETQVMQWKVQVRIDTASLEAKMKEMFPDTELKIGQLGEVITISGLLRSADQVSQMHNFFDKSGYKYVDTTSVAGVQQIKLEIQVAEVSRVALKTLGLNMLYADNHFFGGTFPTSGTPLATGVEITTNSFKSDFSPAVSVLAGIPRANLELFIQAIVENQYMRLLANPTLVSLSGEEASFLAGGEFPIPVAQSSGGSGGNAISIEYREYGVRVTFRPVVLGDGNIRLRVAPEVSELSSAGAIQMQGFSIPSLIIRRAETMLELNSGQTFAMAGLIKAKDEAIKDRLPGIGDLPIIGQLFSSSRYQKNETELVLLVTASLVEPMSLAEQGPLPGATYEGPNDWQFFIWGQIQGKHMERPVIDTQNAEVFKQMGLDQLTGPGGWASYDQEMEHSRAKLRLPSRTQVSAVKAPPKEPKVTQPQKKQAKPKPAEPNSPSLYELMRTKMW